MTKPNSAVNHIVEYPPLQQGLDVIGLPVGEHGRRVDASPRVVAVGNLNSRISGEHHGRGKASGTVHRLAQVDRPSARSIGVMRLLKPHLYVVAQQLAYATKRAIRCPLV